MRAICTAGTPWGEEKGHDQGRRLILHLSLRDIPPRYLLGVRNVTDQVRHAVRERISLTLAVELGLDPAVLDP